MPLARYSYLVKDSLANDILPSMVIYTCHLFIVFSYDLQQNRFYKSLIVERECFEIKNVEM